MLTEIDKENTINAEIEFLKSRGMLIPKDEIKKAYPFPPHKRLFYGFMTDDLGNIYVSKISTIKKEFSYWYRTRNSKLHIYLESSAQERAQPYLVDKRRKKET